MMISTRAYEWSADFTGIDNDGTHMFPRCRLDGIAGRYLLGLVSSGLTALIILWSIQNISKSSYLDDGSYPVQHSAQHGSLLEGEVAKLGFAGANRRRINNFGPLRNLKNLD